MIKLVNGRGQLGERLKDAKDLDYELDVYIYHTWKLDTKSYKEQSEELEKFKEFVKIHKDDKVIFISTKSVRDDWYVHHKQLAEAYLINNCSDCLVIKLPTFIGNHCDMFSLEKLKSGSVKPYGIMEIISIEESVDKIYELCNYKGKLKTINVDGYKVSAKLLYNIYKKIGVLDE